MSQPNCNPIAQAIRDARQRGVTKKHELILTGVFARPLGTSEAEARQHALTAYKALSRHVRCEHGNRRTRCKRCLWAGTGGDSLCRKHDLQKRYIHGTACSECVSELKAGDLDC